MKRPADVSNRERAEPRAGFTPPPPMQSARHGGVNPALRVVDVVCGGGLGQRRLRGGWWLVDALRLLRLLFLRTLVSA